jgi:urease accessory protein
MPARMDVASATIRPGQGRSDVHRVRGAGPLRILCPRAAGNAAWLVTSSLGGGLVDGDHVAFDVSVDAGATCVVTTQASTKVYKGSSSQRTRVRAHGDGIAIVVPDPVVPFRDASFVQATDVVLDADASLVLCDVLTAGRVAFGERWSASQLDATLSIERAGTKLLHDRVLLGNDAAARMRRFEAIGTAVLLGPRVADLAATELARIAAEPLAGGAQVIACASPLGDGVIVRVAGERVEQVVADVRRVLAPAVARLGEDPWSRKW